MGMGGFFQGLDNRIENAANARAAAARGAAVESIRAGMERNPSDPGYAAYMTGNDAPAYGVPYYDAAVAYREGTAPAAWQRPVEAINNAMADSAAARYGVVGGAALGGGMAMTAGAQKLMDLMGLFEEADETEVARDQPLTS